MSSTRGAGAPNNRRHSAGCTQSAGEAKFALDIEYEGIVHNSTGPLIESA